MTNRSTNFEAVLRTSTVSPTFALRALSSITGLALASVLVGCGAPKADAASPVTLTAADVAAPAPAEEPAEPTEEAAEPTSTALETDRPAGERLCRAKDTFGSILEVYVEGSGDDARATLRTLAQSGDVSTEVLRANRHKGILFLDRRGEVDLVAHAATLAKQDGKTILRVGEDAWVTCE